MEWKNLIRLAVAVMLLACVPVTEEKGDDDDDDDDDRGEETAFGDDDDDDVRGDDDDDREEEQEEEEETPGYDGECALGADAYCFCWTYYGYAECDDDEWYSYYDMCTSGEDGGVLECYADHVDADYYVDCYGAIYTCE